jgi:chromate transporter
MNSLVDPGLSEAPARARPASLSELFWSFSWLALQGFGGVLAVAQRELVERKHWLTNEEFVEEWGVAQLMPGPNVVNLSIVLGSRYFGWRGSLVAVAGMLCFPLLIVLVLAALYGQVSGNPAAAGALRGMGAVAAGFIIASGLKLMPALRKNVLGRGWCLVLGLLTFVAVAWLRLPLAGVLIALGAAGWVLAYRKMAA